MGGAGTGGQEQEEGGRAASEQGRGDGGTRILRDAAREGGEVGGGGRRGDMGEGAEAGTSHAADDKAAKAERVRRLKTPIPYLS